MRLLDDVDFLDVVAASFGFLILGALLATHFLGYPENPITKSLQEWFFAILGFIIGKKGFLPKGVTGCVGCMNYRITDKEGEEVPSAGEEALSQKVESPSQGEDPPSGNADRMQS